MRHPDEGVIQGWVEAQLPAGEAAEVASHVAGCAECQALVAEIRGLMARSAGVVAALDGGAVARPAAVVAATGGTRAGRRPVSLRRWVPALAAAVVVLAVMRQASSDAVGREGVREALRGDDGASAPAAERMPAPLPGTLPTPVPAPPAGANAASAPALRAGANDAPAPALAAPVAPASPRAAEAKAADAQGADAAGASARRALGTGPVMLPTVVMPAPSRAEPPSTVAASAPASAPAATPAPTPAPTPAAEPIPMPMPMPMPIQAPRERALMKADRGAPARQAAVGATFEAATGCYRAISGLTLEIYLAASGTARLVARDTILGRWLQEGDSLVVRWRDSVAVFPAGMDRPRGRVGAVAGGSLPLALVRGCP